MSEHKEPKDRLPKKDQPAVLNLDRQKPISEDNSAKGLTLSQFLEHASNIVTMNQNPAGHGKKTGTQEASGQISSLANLKNSFKLKPESKS